MPKIETWVEDSARHRIVREMDVVQSEWPAYQASLLGSAAHGYIGGIVSGSGSILLSVPSSRWFKPRTVWLWNGNVAQNGLFMYVGGSGGSCSASLGVIYVGPYETGFVAVDTITVDGDIWVSCLKPSLGVRIGGVLLNSGPQ